MIAELLLILMSIYLVCGLVFAAPFVLVSVGKIDPHAAHGTWAFRLLIIPGTILLWPLLACRWFKGVHQPPEERNAHRLSAECGVLNAACHHQSPAAESRITPEASGLQAATPPSGPFSTARSPVHTPHSP
jgi:hypothetical protein